jgi:hypothetical protein
MSKRNYFKFFTMYDDVTVVYYLVSDVSYLYV